jgi:HEPN domain-containing protein
MDFNMLDLKKQIQYWCSNGKNDLDTAELLISNGKVLHGLFFCHLAIEKIIKAHYVNTTKEVPPKSHNLIFLSEKANLELGSEIEIFFGILMKFQLEGRYPDYYPEIPPVKTVADYLNKTKDLFLWLQNQL